MEWTRRVEEVWTTRTAGFDITVWTTSTQTPNVVRPHVGPWHVKIDKDGHTMMAGEDDTRMGATLAAKTWLRAYALSQERDPYPTG